MSLPSQHRKQHPSVSSENWDLFSSVPFGPTSDDSAKALPRGRYDDSKTIRTTLVRVMKECGRSRATIADLMSDLTGNKITEQMLYAFTGEREDRRWPAEFDRAFCAATGDYSLIRVRAEMSGLRIINQEEADMLELGRAFLQREQANAKIAELQAKYAGGAR